MIVGSFSKLPGEKRDFSIDWSSRLSDADTIGTSNVTTSGITISGAAFSGKLVTFFAEGGTAGNSYVVTNSIATAAGLTFEAQILIAVADLIGSYATLTEADAYHAARGTAAWLASDLSAREAALVRASDHIKYRYVANLLPGYDETLPLVKVGTMEAAALEIVTPGLFAGVYTPAQQKVLTQVGEIKWTPVENKMTGYEAATPTSSKLEAMFDPYVFSRQMPFFTLRSIGG